MSKIICVVGPTASGKTALAVQLAKELDGEILSCDSMQVYRGMDIGTAKPTEEERMGIPHHMLSVVPPEEPFSVGRFTQMADPVLQDILARGKTAILAGGTGLYVDALISGRQFAEKGDPAIRQRLERRADEEGMETLLRELSGYDPETAGRLHLRDRKRILRAMEIYEVTGKAMSQHDAMSKTLPPKYLAAWLGLWYSDRSELYGRIDLRVDRMLQQGLLEEIRGLLEKGLPPTSTAYAAIGYKEFIRAIKGECSMEEAAEQVKQSSRRYAKRQMTWFRRNEEIFWLDRSQMTEPELFRAVRQYLAKFDGA